MGLIIIKTFKNHSSKLLTKFRRTLKVLMKILDIKYNVISTSYTT